MPEYTLEQIEEFIRGSEWDDVCPYMFEHLALEDPQMLLSLIHLYPWQENLDLAYAAQACFVIKGERTGVAEVLLPLLLHTHGYVREGAADGLAWDANNPEVRAALQRACEVEPFDGVKMAMEEALGDYAAI